MAVPGANFGGKRVGSNGLSLVWYNKKNLGSKSYVVINTRVV